MLHAFNESCGCRCVSAGTTDHAGTNFAADASIKEFLADCQQPYVDKMQDSPDRAEVCNGRVSGFSLGDLRSPRLKRS